MNTDSSTQAKDDPYDPHMVMRWGKYKGQEVDSSVKRPAVILREDADSIAMANFRHLDQFWIAKVPKDGVEQVVFRIDRFPAKIWFVKPAHTLLAFKMKAGSELLLTPQTPNGTSEAEPIPVGEFYFSVDYMAPAGVDYGLVDGMGKTFLAAERFISLHDRKASERSDPKYPSDLLPLSLDEDSMNRLLMKAIRQSNARREDDTYNTMKYNCTTVLFGILDSTLEYGDRRVEPFKESYFHILDPVAGPSHKALRERALVAADAPNPDWVE